MYKKYFMCPMFYFGTLTLKRKRPIARRAPPVEENLFVASGGKRAVLVPRSAVRELLGRGPAKEERLWNFVPLTFGNGFGRVEQ